MNNYRLREKLKPEGDKILIDLNEVKIETKTVSSKVIGRTLSKKYENEKTSYTQENTDVVREKYKGKLINHTVNLLMDTTNLKIHFVLQKTTYLYIDPANPKSNYLNLEFLTANEYQRNR